MNRGRILIATIGAGLTACGPCPTFDEMEVLDPDGLLTVHDRYTIGRAIDEFATWSGRDGACVPGVEVTDELTNRNGEHVGAYRGPHSNIRVSTAHEDLHETTLHELCHAIDYEEKLTKNYGDDFAVRADYEDNPNYRSDLDQRQEMLALNCENGPRLPVWEEIYGDCGLTFDAYYRWDDIDEVAWTHIYKGAESLDPEPGGWPIAFGDEALVEGLGGLLGVYDHLGTPEGLLLLAAYRTAPGRHTFPELILVDPHRAELTQRIPLPFEERERLGLSIGGLELLNAAEGPLLALYIDGGFRYWRVDFDAGVLHEVEAIPLHPYFIRDETLILEDEVFYSDWTLAEPTLKAIDRATGAELYLGLDDQEAWGKTVHVYDLWPTDRGVLLYSLHEGLSEYDLEARTWTHRPIPYWWQLGSEAINLGDGRLLFERALAVDDHSATSYVLYDRREDRWWFPEEPCASLRVDEDSYAEVVQAAGSPWFMRYESTLSQSGPPQYTYTLHLRPITIAPR